MLQYQREAGFTGRNPDNIPGPRTRAAMHGDLMAADPPALGRAAPPSAVSAPANWLTEISVVREALADAEWRLASMQSG